MPSSTTGMTGANNRPSESSFSAKAADLPTTLPLLLLMGTWLFAIGTVVGSFLNVCIYRIPWQKSVIWPASHCPKCWSAIAARDNVPIFGWLALRGRCRSCRSPISIRYPLIEALVGLLFVAIFVVDVGFGPPGLAGRDAQSGSSPPGCITPILIALLVAATFIDYDLYDHPRRDHRDRDDRGGGAWGPLFPWIRPDPSTAPTAWGGLLDRGGRAPRRGRLDLVGPLPRLAGAASRGDGLRRRDPDGDDRRVPGLAGGGPDLLPRPRSSAWRTPSGNSSNTSGNG